MVNYKVEMDAGGGVSSIFTKGRIAVASGVGLLLVLCFVFIGLYISAVASPNQNNNQQGKAAAQNGGNDTTMPPSASTTRKRSYHRSCRTLPCLENTVNVRHLIDSTIDPCEDFYSYSCGQWEANNPKPAGHYFWTTFYKLFKQNDDRVRLLLNAGANSFTRRYTWVAEIKALDLFHSCIDSQTRLRAGANPFVEKILPNVGGWSVMNDLPADWNISYALKKIQVDFLTSALFTVRVDHDNPASSSRPIITLHDGKLGMYMYYFYTSTYTNRVYINYMKQTANLLARDAKITTNQTAKIQTFVNDVMTVETALAKIIERYYYSYSIGSTSITLAQLKTRTNNTLDWVDFMSYLFSEANIDENTKVAFGNGYIEDVFNYLSGLPSATKNRMLSNFLVWQLVMRYTEHLSDDYIHAYRKFRAVTFGYANTPTNEDVCFTYVQQNMDVALNHLYVKKYSSANQMAQVKEIATYVKQAMIDGIDQISFMDDDTKTLAKTRLGQVVDEIGYPDWLSNRDTVDVLYKELTISLGDYFQNMLNLNVYEKLELNKQYTQKDNEFDLHWNLYNTGMYFNPTEYKLQVPVGMLQKPFFSSQYPKFSAYGSFGANFAEAYHSVINNYQQYYYPGSNPWWSETTRTNYSSALDCIGKDFVGKPIYSYVDQYGKTHQVKINKNDARRYAQDTMRNIGGVKRAYQAYKAWLKKMEKKRRPLLLG